MNAGHLQSWLDFAHSLLIFLILVPLCQTGHIQSKNGEFILTFQSYLSVNFVVSYEGILQQKTEMGIYSFFYACYFQLTCLKLNMTSSIWCIFRLAAQCLRQISCVYAIWNLNLSLVGASPHMSDLLSQWLWGAIGYLLKIVMWCTE